MYYMLDTDICSYILKNKPQELAEKFNSLTKETLCISIITYAELMFGIKKKKLGYKFMQTFKDFISRLEIVPFEVYAAKEYAEIRAYLEATGVPIGNMDILIAASAKAINAVLVTNNLKHFNNVPKLKVETWL